jgi:hypothetical protein
VLGAVNHAHAAASDDLVKLVLADRRTAARVRWLKAIHFLSEW